MNEILPSVRSSLVWMRSSLVVRASDSQCRSHNCPGFDPSFLRHSEIWGVADEAMLNIVHKKKKNKKPFKKLPKNEQKTKTTVCYTSAGISLVWKLCWQNNIWTVSGFPSAIALCAFLTPTHTVVLPYFPAHFLKGLCHEIFEQFLSFSFSSISVLYKCT